MPVARLVRDVADRAQQHTQRSWNRPYGVGLLVAGHDKTGAACTQDTTLNGQGMFRKQTRTWPSGV